MFVHVKRKEYRRERSGSSWAVNLVRSMSSAVLPSKAHELQRISCLNLRIVVGFENRNEMVRDIHLVSSYASIRQIPSQSNIQMWPIGSQNLS